MVAVPPLPLESDRDLEMSRFAFEEKQESRDKVGKGSLLGNDERV